MKARTAIAWTAHRVRLTAVGWGLTTVLACVALSACTSSPPSAVVVQVPPRLIGSSRSASVSPSSQPAARRARSASASASAS